MFICMQKRTPFLTPFLRYCKNIANLLLWVLWECLIMPINIDRITLQETLVSKVLKSTLMFICMQKSTSSLISCLRYCKDIPNLLFWELWKYFTIPIKTIVLTCRKPSCSSACKKSTSSLTSFARHCKEIANLLFWVIGACLATHT